MQALHDFRDLRNLLRSAQIARQAMRDPNLGQHRKDQATVAHGRALDRIFEVLDRLDRDPMLPVAAAKPTLATLEDMLAAIALGEPALRRLA